MSLDQIKSYVEKRIYNFEVRRILNNWLDLSLVLFDPTLIEMTVDPLILLLSLELTLKNYGKAKKKGLDLSDYLKEIEIIKKMAEKCFLNLIDYVKEKVKEYTPTGLWYDELVPEEIKPKEIKPPVRQIKEPTLKEKILPKEELPDLVLESLERSPKHFHELADELKVDSDYLGEVILSKLKTDGKIELVGFKWRIKKKDTT